MTFIAIYIYLILYYNQYITVLYSLDPSQGFDFAYSAAEELVDCVMRSGRASTASADCVGGPGPWQALGLGERQLGATNRYEFFEKAVERRLNCSAWRTPQGVGL